MRLLRARVSRKPLGMAKSRSTSDGNSCVVNQRDEFGPALRCERERRGISLQQIADSTKISAALFAGLERNDVSRWPCGIYRRSFFRAYAEAVGLDAEHLVEQFQRLFPCDDDGEPAGVERGSGHLAANSTSDVPTQAMTAGRPPRTLLRRLASFSIDLVLIALAGVFFLAAYGWHAVWPALAAASGVVLVATPIIAGSTPGTWLLRRGSAAPVAGPTPVPIPIPVQPPEMTRRHAGEPPVTVRRHQGKKSGPGSSRAAHGRHGGARGGRPRRRRGSAR